jgi:hypothetical protein
MERVELQIQIVLGRFAGIDGAANDLGSAQAAASSEIPPFLPCPSLSPKNLGPFQLVPLMILAIADRLE